MEDGIDLGNFKDEEELITFILDAIGDEATAQRVVEVVSLLTKNKNAPYDSYISAVASDEDALIVKLADMLHNLSDNPSDRQIGKYGKAINYISELFQGPPAAIAGGHWKALTGVLNNESNNQ